MRSPKTNGLKSDPRPPKDYWGAVPPPPSDAAPAEQFAWTLLALRALETRIARLTSAVAQQDERLDHLGKSVIELRRMLVICFAIVALGAVIGAIRSWWGF